MTDYIGPEMTRSTPLDLYMQQEEWSPTFGTEMRERFLSGVESTIPAFMTRTLKAGAQDKYQLDFNDFMGVSLPEDYVKAPDPIKPYTDQEWKESGFYREGMEFQNNLTPARAEVLADLHDTNKYRASLLRRSSGGIWRGLVGLGAEFGGNALDPINFIPVFGGASRLKAIAKYGSIRGRAMLSAAEAGVTSAAVTGFFQQERKQAGLPYGWELAAKDVLFSAAIGTFFGGATGVVAKLRNTDWALTQKSVLDLKEDGKVDVSPIFDQEPELKYGAREIDSAKRYFSETDEGGVVNIEDLQSNIKVSKEKIKNARTLLDGIVNSDKTIPSIEVASMADGTYKVVKNHAIFEALRTRLDVSGVKVKPVNGFLVPSKDKVSADFKVVDPFDEKIIEGINKETDTIIEQSKVDIEEFEPVEMVEIDKMIEAKQLTKDQKITLEQGTKVVEDVKIKSDIIKKVAECI